MPKVARAPKGSPRVSTKLQDNPTPAEPNASSLTDLSPPESITGDEDSNGEDDVVYNIDSLTSHTTASNSTSADILSAEAGNSVSHSITESQFRTVMHYMEDSGHTSDNVFIETSSSIDPHVSQHIPQSPIPTDTSHASSPLESPPEQSPAPRRSARSTRGAPPVHFGKVITHCTSVMNMSDTPAYRQTLFVSCMPNIVLA